MKTSDSFGDDGGRRVDRDEQLGPAEGNVAGPGTYVDGDVIRARFDGDMFHEENVFRVARERRPIPRTRSRRGTPAQKPGTKSGKDPVGAATHRHGAGKHGALRGKKKKGMGDQGTWD